MMVLSAGKSFEFLTTILSSAVEATSVENCPGYKASNVQYTDSGVSADLTLAGPACDVYGTDLNDLRMVVNYETESRVHVKIYDADEHVYQVPESVLPRPDGSVNAEDAALKVFVVEDPFSFAIQRSDGSDTIFNTSGSKIIFESQYLRLRTSLPPNPVLYGLGEHTDPLMLNTTNYTRTIWSRDAGTVPEGTNLYGNHPIYFENRPASNSSHGVVLINSNGMDIKINNSKDSGQYLEYNTLGGVWDFYLMAGPDPIDVARQTSDVTGKAAMMPYWGFGFHNCRFGYSSVDDVAEVVYNYSVVNIPLETMWTDIDYMDEFKIFTLNPKKFPLQKMRELVDYLHDHGQHYVVMVDPATAYQDYTTFNEGEEAEIFLKIANGSTYKGVVWPGTAAFPDWFHNNTQAWWDQQSDTFFNQSTGIDIDALWTDMNEPSNFCVWPCEYERSDLSTREVTAKKTKTGLAGRDLINPQYTIQNAAGSLSNKTAFTNLIHDNGLTEYDTHNLYGSMMSSASRHAMLSRRPTRRPLIVTRSTFIGAGTKVAHWLGDNVSNWTQYVTSIRHLLQFASLFQVPMVGADVCGFIDNTTEILCARWATLGAFYTFYRNHNDAAPNIPQEFYRWPLVAEAARGAIQTRYRLLDYIYTAFHKQTVDGTPVLSPMWFMYPIDPITYPIQTQFFYGTHLLISPVIAENSTNVTIYLPPSSLFYDFYTLLLVSPSESTNLSYPSADGASGFTTLTNISFTQTPVKILGGSIIPLRISGANTMKALRTVDFELIVAPDKNGGASGELYLDDGESIDQDGKITEAYFGWDGKTLSMNGTFSYEGEDMAAVKMKWITLLDGNKGPVKYVLNKPLTESWSVDVEIFEKADG